jgi:hypothetical protein
MSEGVVIVAMSVFVIYVMGQNVKLLDRLMSGSYYEYKATEKSEEKPVIRATKNAIVDARNKHNQKMLDKYTSI